MKKIVVVFLIVLVTAVLVAGTIFFLDTEVLSLEKEEGLTAEEIAELSIDTDVITTNLASKHFAVVQFNILLDNKQSKKELELRTPEVRAAIISTVAGFTRDELTGQDGIDLLETELFRKLENMLQIGEVSRVLVTEYKIQ